MSFFTEYIFFNHGQIAVVIEEYNTRCYWQNNQLQCDNR